CYPSHHCFWQRLTSLYVVMLLPFYFQAEDGIRDRNVTGVQTCALPILGLGLLVEQIRTALPGLPQTQVRTAVEQSSDAAGAVSVLGLSPELTTEVREFLLGQRPGDDVAGAFWIEPLTAGEHVRRRAQEAADEARRAAGNAA